MWYFTRPRARHCSIELSAQWTASSQAPREGKLCLGLGEPPEPAMEAARLLDNGGNLWQQRFSTVLPATQPAPQPAALPNTGQHPLPLGWVVGSVGTGLLATGWLLRRKRIRA